MNPKGNPKGDGVMTFEDIARELGISPTAAVMAYRRALRKLRRARQSKEAFELAKLKGRSV